MAPIYSRQLWAKGSFVAELTGEYVNDGPGTVIIHDMIYAPTFDTPPFGGSVACNITEQLNDVTLWQLLSWTVQPGATYHWTGRIVLPPGDGIYWTVQNVLDGISGFGYYLAP
jgi:hypothetical protein